MTSYVSPELRRIVEERAGNRCEYCLIHEDNTYVGCHVDHIIAEKHGGRTELDNLALACAFCNRAKGTDIASILPGTQALVRLFNLRSDCWNHHFRIIAGSFEFQPISDIGLVTINLLQLNQPDRVLERRTIAESGRFSAGNH